ncbi:MAG: hypothetical protein JXO51_08640 [Candidatus Aminicenantes bacterium]|nr:hypothetical protein [Candidatus Aminicenantes bacterium]
MKSIFYVLVVAAGCGAIWGTVAGILIAGFLEKRGIKTPFLLLRLYFFRNVSRYKKITTEESGRPGDLYYHCVYAFNAALVMALAALTIRFLTR